jgi:nucleotidyltransferase/DNA polymerase involved in DNA repair
MPPTLVNAIAWLSTTTANFRELFTGVPVALASHSGGGGQIGSYLRESRLSFLGGWAASNREALAALQRSAGGPRPLAGAPRCVLHVDIDAFFAQAAVAGDPTLAGVAVAVCSGNATGWAEVACFSYEARACGARAGMPFGMAAALCSARGVTLRAARYDLAAFSRLSLAFHGALFGISAACQAASVDEAYLDCSGLGEPAALAAAARAAVLAATGLRVSVGVGPNRLLAKMGTRQAKPPGGAGIFVVADAAAGRALLAPLAVRSLHGVGHSTEEALTALGYLTCGDVAAASLAQLRRALGHVRGAQLHALAGGEDDSPVDAEYVPPASLSVECNYGVRPANERDTQQLLIELSAQLCDKMAALSPGGATAGRLRLRLLQSKDVSVPPGKPNGCGDCYAHSCTRSFAQALRSSRPRDMAGEAKSLLLQLMAQHRCPVLHVRGLGLAVEQLQLATSECPLEARSPQQRPQPAPLPGPVRKVAFAADVAYAETTFTQVETTETFRSLPPDIQQELRVGLPKSKRRPEAQSPKPAATKALAGLKRQGRKADAAQTSPRVVSTRRSPPHLLPAGGGLPAVELGPPRLCVTESLDVLRSALRRTVPAVCARGEPSAREDGLAATAALLLAACVDKVRAHNCEAALALAQAGSRLAAAHPAWAPHCELVRALLNAGMCRGAGGERVCALPGWTKSFCATPAPPASPTAAGGARS